MTGKSLASVNVSTGASVGSTSPYVINFALKSDASTLFADYTGNHVNQIPRDCSG